MHSSVVANQIVNVFSKIGDSFVESKSDKWLIHTNHLCTKLYQIQVNHGDFPLSHLLDVSSEACGATMAQVT